MTAGKFGLGFIVAFILIAVADHWITLVGLSRGGRETNGFVADGAGGINEVRLLPLVALAALTIGVGLVYFWRNRRKIDDSVLKKPYRYLGRYVVRASSGEERRRNLPFNLLVVVVAALSMKAAITLKNAAAIWGGFNLWPWVQSVLGQRWQDSTTFAVSIGFFFIVGVLVAVPLASRVATAARRA